MRTAFTAFLTLLVLGACAPAASDGSGQPPAVIAGADETPQLRGPVWRLVSITLPGGTSLVPESGDYTLEFTEEGRVNARLHCNSGGSNYEAGDDGSISFGPIVSTLMFCAADSIATDFGSALQDATAYNFTGGDLFINSPQGTVVHLSADDS